MVEAVESACKLKASPTSSQALLETAGPDRKRHQEVSSELTMAPSLGQPGSPSTLALEDESRGSGSVESVRPSSRLPEMIVPIESSTATVSPHHGLEDYRRRGRPAQMDLDEAYLKLKAMCDAASMLRTKYA